MTSPRQLGWLSATCLVIASMIGTGVFTTSGFLLADLQSPIRVLAVWGLGGLLATLGALSYGALARRIPESGGEYLFLSRTVHPAAGFIAGWVSLLVGFSAPLAAAAYGFGEYTKTWFPGMSPKALGTVLVVGFALLHATHVRRGAWVQNAVVVLKVLLILGFLGYGVTCLGPPLTSTPPPLPLPLATYAVSLVWVSFSYSGWNAAIYIGGEVSDPERNLPRSMLWGTLLVTGLYLALNAVFVYAAPIAVLAGKAEVGRIAAEALGGRLLAEAVTGVIALALITSVSSLVMTGPRVYAQMAADGVLPRWLAAKEGRPRAAIVLQTALALAFLWGSAYDRLLTYIGFTLGLSTAATVTGLIRLRRREGPAMRVPGWPWVPILFLAGVTGITALTIRQRPAESLVGLATLVAGWIAWRASLRPTRRKPPGLASGLL